MRFFIPMRVVTHNSWGRVYCGDRAGAGRTANVTERVRLGSMLDGNGTQQTLFEKLPKLAGMAWAQRPL